MMKLPKIMTVAAALLSIGAARAGVISFNFDGLDPNNNNNNITYTPLTLADPSGLTATFSSSGDPGGFEVLNLLGSLSFADDVLVAPGTGPFSLEIVFSQPVTSFSGEFATEGPGPLTLTADLGGVMVGSTSQTGTVPTVCPAGCSGSPEGMIGFTGTFDSLVLSDSTDPGFALGNFQVTTPSTSVPEPSTLALIAAGLAALAGAARRRRARA